MFQDLTWLEYRNYLSCPQTAEVVSPTGTDECVDVTVTDAAIQQRMVEFGTNNLSTYLRTMAMDGIFPTVDNEESSKNGKCERS